MCGITGFFSNTYLSKSIPEITQTLFRMTSSLVHRGPDDEGSWIDPDRKIALGHRRLSIIDLSPAGHQPMHSFCGRYVCVYNGEIYNFPEIKSELEQYDIPVWRGHSDTEVMLAAFSVWGIPGSIPRFNGMFACAVYDRQEKCLFLIRDRMGKKPLYYGVLGQTLLFGSELKSLVSFNPSSFSVDRNALTVYLRYNHIPAPYSIYSNIYKLPQATFIKISIPDILSGILPEPVTYWNHFDSIKRAHIESPSERDSTAELETLLRDAVKQRMVSDVPLGVFLSGGIDSSLVTAIMQTQSSVPVKSFSIGFSEQEYNEAEHAKKIAKYLGTDHTEIYCTPKDTLAVVDLLPSIFDEPFADSSQIPTYLVSKLARNHVTVALTGDGGDEIFGGYTRYQKAHDTYSRLHKIPGFIRKIASIVIPKLPVSVWNILLPSSMASASSSTGDRIHKFSESLNFRDFITFYTNAFLSHWKRPCEIVKDGIQPPLLFDSRFRENASKLNHFEQMMLLDSIHYLPDDILVKVDRTSMAVSLETRAPLLDYRVYEFAWSLPISEKIADHEGKVILKKLLYKYVPASFFERPKQGFSVPIARWLRKELKDWAGDLLNPGVLRKDGFLDETAISGMWNEHLSGKRNFSYYLWDILMFQSWLKAQRQ